MIDKVLNNKSIIVVGNGGSIKDKEYGEVIDSHDVVIKFNHGAVLGQDDPIHFGKKCTVWVYAMCNENLCRRRWREFKTKPDYSLRGGTKHVSGLEHSILYTYDSEGLYKELGIHKRLYPSTGMVIIYYIINNIKYKSLDIAGFDGFKTSNFYEKVIQAHKWHSGVKENILIQKYKNEGRLNIL